MDGLLTNAEAKQITLVLPSFAMSEPFSAVMYRGGLRRGLRESMERKLRQMGRSMFHQSLVTTLSPMLQQFLDAGRLESSALERVIERILACAQLIPLSTGVFAQALHLRTTYDLEMQDAIILASVLGDAHERGTHDPACFVSLNTRDFGDPGIRAELRASGVTYLTSFTAAVTFVQPRNEQTTDN